jgi:hypothetical protein
MNHVSKKTKKLWSKVGGKLSGLYRYEPSGSGGGTPEFVTVVWPVVVLVAEGSLEQETSIRAKTESAQPSMIALFIT